MKRLLIALIALIVLTGCAPSGTAGGTTSAAAESAAAAETSEATEPSKATEPAEGDTDISFQLSAFTCGGKLEAEDAALELTKLLLASVSAPADWREWSIPEYRGLSVKLIPAAEAAGFGLSADEVADGVWVVVPELEFRCEGIYRGIGAAQEGVWYAGLLYDAGAGFRMVKTPEGWELQSLRALYVPLRYRSGYTTILANPKTYSLVGTPSPEDAAEALMTALLDDSCQYDSARSFMFTGWRGLTVELTELADGGWNVVPSFEFRYEGVYGAMGPMLDDSWQTSWYQGGFSVFFRMVKTAEGYELTAVGE